MFIIKLASKNSKDGALKHTGAMIDRDLVDQFDAILDRKCLQKASVIRRLVNDFVVNDGFAEGKGNG